VKNWPISPTMMKSTLYLCARSEAAGMRMRQRGAKRPMRDQHSALRRTRRTETGRICSSGRRRCSCTPAATRSYLWGQHGRVNQKRKQPTPQQGHVQQEPTQPRKDARTDLIPDALFAGAGGERGLQHGGSVADASVDDT
jgi:hypothetical protein